MKALDKKVCDLLSERCDNIGADLKKKLDRDELFALKRKVKDLQALMP